MQKEMLFPRYPVGKENNDKKEKGTRPRPFFNNVILSKNGVGQM
jgi:hypothetical protein